MADNADNTLIAEPRSVVGSRPAGRLRREGKVPAVMYGLDTETANVTVPSRKLNHILAGESGANTLITLELDGEEHLALARQIQRHPTRGDLLHVDFIRVRRDVAVAAEIPVHLAGEPEGVRDGGILEQLVFTLSIEAKPEDIPPSVEADVSALEIGDQLRIADLRLPPGVAVQQEADELVVQVIVPRVVEEPEAVEAGEEIEGEAPEGEEGEVGPAAEGGEGGEAAASSDESSAS
ncbi:MAG TPA: 50S ribosomal protein L25 [Acidimicrobiia bacterium]|nr:50S ribosomal protein L25 [Acidimicrobiia bacterium]